MFPAQTHTHALLFPWNCQPTLRYQHRTDVMPNTHASAQAPFSREEKQERMGRVSYSFCFCEVLLFSVCVMRKATLRHASSLSLRSTVKPSREPQAEFYTVTEVRGLPACVCVCAELTSRVPPGNELTALTIRYARCFVWRS